MTQPVTDTPAATVKTQLALPTGTSPATASPTLPAPTDIPSSTATATPSLANLLLEVVESEAWPVDGMDESQVQRWENYARSGSGLSSAEELAYVDDFVSQWRVLTVAARLAVIPQNATVAYRAAEFIHEIGGPQPVLYAALAGEDPGDQEQLFLIALDEEENPAGLVAAPVIEGLTQHIHLSGRWVEYRNDPGGGTRLLADARKILPGSERNDVLLLMLHQEYRRAHPYVRSGLYPRFKFAVDGVGANFYTIEKLLTYAQLIQMTEAFDLLSRPQFSALKTAMFGTKTSVTVIKGSDEFLGITSLGTGVMQLNRRDLLGDKYLLVSVLVHEGAHVLQTRPSSGGDACKKSLRREVGDHSLPEGFFDWSAEQVIDGISDQRIGAYHAGFWVLEKLGVLGTKFEYWPEWREVIRTGKFQGFWVSMYCK